MRELGQVEGALSTVMSIAENRGHGRGTRICVDVERESGANTAASRNSDALLLGVAIVDLVSYSNFTVTVTVVLFVKQTM